MQAVQRASRQEVVSCIQLVVIFFQCNTFHRISAGESRKEATVTAVMRPQTPTSGNGAETLDSEALPDIEKYRYDLMIIMQLC